MLFRAISITLAKTNPPGSSPGDIAAVSGRWCALALVHDQAGLGACLADDMGLGKTIEVLALLLIHRRETKARRARSLIVAPASLLSNWSAEIERFTPALKAVVAHPSARPPDHLKALGPKSVKDADLVITSYGSLLRLPWLAETDWNLAILDEAQAIKNPNAKQTRAARNLRARARIALTGTPVENRLADLWSIFDFINPGLLGLWPFPDLAAAEVGKKVKRIMVPEMNLGQVAGEVKKYVPCEVISLTQTNGEVIRPQTLIQALKKI